jgi:integrase
MQVNSTQQAATLELDANERGSVPFTSALASVVLGSILTVAAFTPARTQAKPNSHVITVEAPASVAAPLPPGLQFPLSSTFESKPQNNSNLSTQASLPTALHPPAPTPTLSTCTGDANSTATRRKSMSRRIIVHAGTTEPEIRQRGYVYQKGRKQSDPWLPKQRAYGFFRKDIPDQSTQVEVRPALGFCRDRMGAMLKLHQAMQVAGVLDVEKIRERITPVTTFESQSAWWLAEIKAGRIVNSKTRKPIRTNTTDYYSNAASYLNEVVGNYALASLDNPEAREMVSKMKAELKDNERRFSDKTIVEFFKVFKKVIASAKGEKLRQVYPREWDLAYIGLPKVSKREQHRPTFTATEIVHIVKSCKRAIYRVAVVLLVATGIRIAELLALEVGKHISPDCTVVYIRQQRTRKGKVAATPKTDAGYRDVDVHPLVAKMLREYIGNRKSGFLLETETGNMLWPGTLYRDGLKTILKGMGRGKVRFHAFRRFRQAVLEKSEARQLLIDFWLGHDNSDMSSRYAKQLTEDMEFRHEWAGKVGLGFELPEVSESKSGANCATCATEVVDHGFIATA